MPLDAKAGTLIIVFPFFPRMNTAVETRRAGQKAELQCPQDASFIIWSFFINTESSLCNQSDRESDTMRVILEKSQRAWGHLSRTKEGQRKLRSHFHGVMPKLIPRTRINW